MTLPCPACGGTGPQSIAWEPDLKHGRGEGRLAYRHLDTGVTCYPLRSRERHLVHCSSCGADLAFTLIATPGAISGGVTRELACACGARWKLLPHRATRVRLYLSEVA